MIIADRDSAEGPKAAQKLGTNAKFTQFDVADEDQWKQLFSDTVESYRKVDVLVNNAGIGPTNDVENITLDEWQNVLNVDLTGVMLGTHYAVLHMKENGGSIINVASVAPDLPLNNEFA